MHSGKTIFAQFIEQLPHPEFSKCVARYHGNYPVRSRAGINFSAWLSLNSPDSTVSATLSRASSDGDVELAVERLDLWNFSLILGVFSLLCLTVYMRAVAPAKKATI